MNALNTVWYWLSQSKNQKILGWIGVGLVIAVAALWQANQYFSEQSKDPAIPTILASPGGIATKGNVPVTVPNGGNAFLNTGSGIVTFAITIEQYEAGLKGKEQEVRGELSQASADNIAKTALLEKQLADIQSLLKNPESTLENYKAKLAVAYKAFDHLKNGVLPEQIKQAQKALTQGETTVAEKLFMQVLTQGTQNAAEAAYQLGQLAESSIDYQTADRYYRKALELQPDNPLYLNQAGYNAVTMGHYAEAEPLFQRSLAIREKALGPDHPDVALSLNKLAELYRAQGQYEKAEPLYLRSLALREKALGPEHPDVASSLNNLAELYDAQGQYGKAEPLLQRSLAILEKALGPEHPDVAASLNNLAVLYDAQGQYKKAEPLYQRALAILEKALGPEHPDLGLLCIKVRDAP